MTHYFEANIALFAAQQTHQLMQQFNLQIEEIECFVLGRCQNSAHVSFNTRTPGIGKLLV